MQLLACSHSMALTQLPLSKAFCSFYVPDRVSAAFITQLQQQLTLRDAQKQQQQWTGYLVIREKSKNFQSHLLSKPVSIKVSLSFARQTYIGLHTINISQRIEIGGQTHRQYFHGI